MSASGRLRVLPLSLWVLCTAVAVGCGGEDDDGVKYVFLSSTKHTGDLTASSPIMTTNGLDAGDAICQGLADAADLPGTYAAWLSSATVAVADTLPLDPANDDLYILVDGTVIAQGFADVLDGIDNPIQIDEDGNLVPPFGNDSFVWTGSYETGQPQTDAVCSDWTDGTSGSGGVIGEYLATNEYWSRISGRSCEQQFRLYCFER